MIANVVFEFTQRKYTRWYYGINDIMKGIGGIRATVLPIIAFLIPFIVIYFLKLLAEYIKWAATKSQVKELIDLVNTAHTQLLLIRNAAEKMMMAFDPSIMNQLNEIDKMKIVDDINVDDEEAD